MKELLRSLRPHAFPFLILILTTFVYFMPQFEGKQVRQPDLIQSYKGTKESWDHYAKTGERNLWSNAMFSGMPTHQSGGLENNNIYQYLNKGVHFFFKKPIGIFLFGCVSMYVLLFIVGVGPWLSALGALTFAFSTNYIILYAVGHNSKLDVLMTMPLILAGVYSLFRKNYYTGLLILIIGIGTNLYQNHYQMSYYIALFLGLYYLMELFRFYREKDWSHIKKVILFTIIPILLAIGASMTRVLTTIEYTPESTRGDKIVSYDESIATAGESGGMKWEFATRFSFNLVDLGSMIVPRLAGGGGKENVTPDSELGRAIRQSSYPTQSSRTPTYYGNQPFTEGPPYIGIVVFLLFVLSFFVLGKRWKIWTAICVGFTVIYSLGNSLGGFHEFLFETIPLFDRFRAPSSMLAAVVMFFPLMAWMGLNKITKTKDREKYIKPLYYGAGGLIGLLVFLLILGPSLINMTHPGDANLTQFGIPQSALQSQRLDFFRADLLRAILLSLLTAGTIWLFLKKKIKSGLTIAIIGFLAVADLINIDLRYLDHDRFSVSERNVRTFKPSEADKQILQDPDPHYRVFDLSQNPFLSSDASYFHKSIGGYHAAKLRRYQDIIDMYLRNGNLRVASMLNAKYFIRKGQNGEKTVEQNSMALGNAWFVDNIIFAQDDQTEAERLRTFEPNRSAIIHQEFRDYVAGLNPSLAATIELKSYSPDELIYQYNSVTENLAIFSEVWYGPDKGWQAYIDDQPVKHIRANYVLRALRVPAGNHVIRFEFSPRSYSLGETLSLIFSIICGLIILALAVYLIRNQMKEARNAPNKPKVVKKQRVKKKRSRKKS